MGNLFYTLIIIGILAGILIYANQFVYEEMTRKRIKYLFDMYGIDFKELNKLIIEEVIYCIKQIKKSRVKTNELTKSARLGILHVFVYIVCVLSFIGIVIYWSLALMQRI